MNEALPDLKKESTAAAPDVVLGFGNAAGFAMLQRAATLLSNSTLVPEAYRAWIKDKNNKYGPLIKNDAAISNCVIALNMAQRLEADPIMIMQNLYVVEGRPSWSSQFIIAALNTTGRFSPLRFTISDPIEKEVQVTIVDWIDKKKHVEEKTIKIKDRTCIAWAIEKGTGERLESPPVSIEMAALEGWLTKKGSKWQTMPDLMLRYRAATLFGRLYAPEKLMGLQTEDETRDVFDLEPSNGGYSMPETTPANPTAEILARAAQAQSEVSSQAPQDHPAAQPQDAPQDASAPSDSTKQPRATAALRDEVVAMAESVGLDVPTIEEEFGAYARNWTFAQCEDVRARASAVADQMAQEGEDAA